MIHMLLKALGTCTLILGGTVIVLQISWLVILVMMLPGALLLWVGRRWAKRRHRG